MNYLEVARALGIQGTDEQIFILCDYVRNEAMAAGKALTGREIHGVFQNKVDKLESLCAHVAKDRALLKRLTKDFYATYEIIDEKDLK